VPSRRYDKTATVRNLRSTSSVVCNDPFLKTAVRMQTVLYYDRRKYQFITGRTVNDCFTTIFTSALPPSPEYRSFLSRFLTPLLRKLCATWQLLLLYGMFRVSYAIAHLKRFWGHMEISHKKNVKYWQRASKINAIWKNKNGILCVYLSRSRRALRDILRHLKMISEWYIYIYIYIKWYQNDIYIYIYIYIYILIRFSFN